MGILICVLIYLAILVIMLFAIPAMLAFREAARYRRMCEELRQAKLTLIARGRTGRR